MEQQILELIATDRIEIPMSSMEQKLRRAKKKSATEIADMIGVGFGYHGYRVYAAVCDEDKERARGMKEAVAEFCEDFPKYGRILKGKIDEKRALSETHLYFGTLPGCRLDSENYLGVMQSLGLSERAARELYPEIMNISRRLEKARNTERSIIVGKYSED